MTTSRRFVMRIVHAAALDFAVALALFAAIPVAVARAQAPERVVKVRRAAALGAMLLASCAAPGVAPAPPPEAPVTIHLVSHGWHAGIVVRQADVPPRLWPERRDFPHAEYLEVGWGDRDFYRSPDPGVWLALRAALVPTPSVLHVVGFTGPVAGYFGSSEVVELAVSRAGFERLVRYIHDAHERGGAPAAEPLGPALYGRGYFYPARESFHLLRTCNVWTARALREAGLAVRDSITSAGLMEQARAIGRVLERPAR
jgi:uncharacterized protein (TIGR02117 family)